MKTIPGGEESDIVLVSCAGVLPKNGMLDGKAVSQEQMDTLKAFKAKGENALRNSGLGYTIIRPGPLRDEIGGRNALVFDQGGRIEQSISCADVADICLKALHETTSRNKSFEVCDEYVSENSMYELVAHLPNQSTNYLAPAMQALEPNS